MFRSFDSALTEALSSEFSMFGESERSLATAAARRASTENRVKAMNEATLGKVGFALIHDTASTRFHEDAELTAGGRSPIHHPISFYLSMAATYRKSDKAKDDLIRDVAPPSTRAAA